VTHGGVHRREHTVFSDDLQQAGLAAALEDAGFLFTGILPGGRSGDWLILQYFNGVLVDYDAMQVEDQATQDLLAYIRANDRHEA